MKVLMVRPLEHPVVLDIENSLESLYRELECRTITAVYPWEDPVVLVTDDEGMLLGKPVCRYIEELRQPIVGNFLLCGEGDEDFADLPDELVEKYRSLFWRPEAVVDLDGQLVIVPLGA